MDGIGLLLIAVATAFNLLIIKSKLEKKRFEDAILDFTILTVLALVFSNSFGGLVIATITSAIISLYFLASPPTFFSKSPTDTSSSVAGLFAEFKDRARRPYE